MGKNVIILKRLVVIGRSGKCREETKMRGGAWGAELSLVFYM